MKNVVLAAGVGTRLRPITETKLKGLVDVVGKPLLSDCFDDLLALGIDEIILLVGYRAENIVDSRGNCFNGFPLTYVHQRTPSGLAGVLLTTSDHKTNDFVLMTQMASACSRRPRNASVTSPMHTSTSCRGSPTTRSIFALTRGNLDAAEARRLAGWIGENL